MSHGDLIALRDTAEAALEDFDVRARVRRDVHHSGRDWLLASGTDDEGQLRKLRPINTHLFIEDRQAFRAASDQLDALLWSLSRRQAHPQQLARAREERLVCRVLYTTMQAIGCAMDLHLHPQQARKQAGNRFEDLIAALSEAIRIGHRTTTAVVPYEFDEDLAGVYRPQLDRVLSSSMRATADLQAGDIICSVKMSSKDRFSKIFSDRHVLNQLHPDNPPVIALFHNDVQRVGDDQVASTFVPHNFLAYVKSFGALDGVFYLDPPPHAELEPWSRYLRTFDDFLTVDLWERLFPEHAQVPDPLSPSSALSSANASRRVRGLLPDRGLLL